MKKKLIFIMLIVILLLMTVACSNKTTDKESKENVTTEKETTIVKDDFESQAITAILECSHVIDNMEANRLSEVSIEIMNKSVDGYSAEVTCNVIYSNEYVEMQERLICILEEWSEGWIVEEVEIDSELEYTKQAKVYYLNFRPWQHETWQYLAEEYSNETGIEVTVETVSGGTYLSTLLSKLEQINAPTMFYINGFGNGDSGVTIFKDYCYDLSNASVTKELTSSVYSLVENGNVYGVGYAIETYGIIVNKTLLKEAGYEISDIKSFDDLKMVAEDITRRSDELGFAAFSSAGMDGSSSWRFNTHLANLPIYFEYKADGINNTDAIKGDYLDNYRDIFDLYINNSTCEGNELSVKTYEDSINEFLDGRAVFYQNGSWMYSIISEVYLDNELAMIPIYIGVGDEANQGLCTGSENYWCVNKYASEEDIQATLDFMYWCVTSEKGTKTMANEMGWVIPYKKAVEPSNIFIKQDLDYTAEGKCPVTWTFSTMPSEMWKNNVGSALTVYAAEPTDSNWKAVEEAFVNGWKEEYNSNNF